MSDPSIIFLITEDYKHMIQQEAEARRAKGIVQDPQKPQDGIGNLQSIFDAKRLFAEIEPQLESSDFYLLSVSGQQGSGKSTLARELTHFAHLAGYKPIYSSGFDIMEAPDTFSREAVGFDKVCIILDDLSYVLGAVSGKAQSKSKSFFGLIRHFLTQANNGKPVKVMVIVIAHFTTAIPPMFKNTNVWVFSKPTTLEYDAMIKVVGRNQNSRDQLDKIFNAVMKIQALANKNKDLVLTFQDSKYSFRWGSKEDPGNGRLVMLILNGKPMIYNSHNEYCKICEHVGFGVRVQSQDYQMARPADNPREEGKN